ncbi:MAG: D-aminoacyl-tRNA deacylase [Bacteroidales bacterium]|jgi:D-tyrosyl-tRNA(Tyr) deacylase|nr:D-aminoacyl-tRNA deacylase [Bacteroidales bacterium]HHT52877.1 D-tyrosyl-tRNA(Tyr) deacylase [Bacteroidales bacterium]
MRVVIQRVRHAAVHVENREVGSIGEGLLIFLGIEEEDGEEDLNWLASKIVKLRIFPDEQDQMNLSVMDHGGSILVVSQFTLHALTKKGNRPSFIRAAEPEKAKRLYLQMIDLLSELTQKPVAQGEFGAMMDVSLLNWGPVTIWIDTKRKE